ncbi:MAG: WD40-like beta Propeller containing protein [Acidobacteria bacterium]|nr:WD40-like beta Propeller containing protein [Acidobacteriota bacterium]
MKKILALTTVALSLGALVFIVEAAPQPPASGATAPLTIDQLIDIRHPSNPVWSPDGRHVAFVSERAGIANIFVADIAGASASSGARAVTRFADGQGAGFFWSADGQRLYFPRQGDLWQVALNGGEPSAVWSTPQVESGITQSPDASRVAFVRSASAAATAAAPARSGRGGAGAGGDLMVRTLADGKESVVVRGDGRAIGGVSWSPDGQSIVFGDGARTIRHEQTPAYSGSKIIYTISENVPGDTFVVPVAGGTPVSLGNGGGFGARRWIDATHFLVDRTSPDFKRRTTAVVSTKGGEPAPIHEETSEKFWSITGDAGPQPSPDGRWIAFLSDRDGWDHIFVMPAAGGAAVQITKGRFEVRAPQWSPDSTRIAFDANEPDHYGDRHLYVATLGADPARATIAAVTSGRGTDTAPQWSPDSTRLVFQHTDPHNSADLWLADAKAAAKPARLSDSMPAAMDRSAFVEPESVSYAGPDGQKVPAWLFVPKGLDRSKKHPAIVWIHGDGVNQGYDGWHVQRNYAVYYSFHQYLLQKGYVVIMPDYRGSIGYGKAWREGVYMDVGGKDAKDAWMVTNYLKTLPYVDMDRVGVWGLSYGGFFTLIAVTDQPRLFRAAVDVAGVADYAMYYDDPYHGGWTASRIGTPDQHPDVYANASPVSHVDRLERPLLILHGTSDVNVPYLHSVRLIDELLKKGKGDLVSFMTYPGEFHYFTREHVLRDAWHRVEDFFNANLKGSTVTSH